MKVLSLFDGISCGMVALERIGISVEKYDAFEIDKNAIKVSSKNYPQIIHHGDVFDGKFSDFKGYDLLIGGSPCTYWSIAKNNRETNPDGIGGKLFMQFVYALHQSQCRYFLYENNYSIHENIKNFISEQLGVSPIMINSAFVSAQQRKRCYWTNIPNVRQPDNKGILVKDILESDISYYNKAYCLDEKIKEAVNWNLIYDSQKITEINSIMKPIRIGQYGKGGQGQRIYSIYGKSITLSANGGGQGAKTGLYKIDLPDDSYIIRKLTPIEAERLQTLPDNYTEGISDAQRYKCIGNGWTVDVIAHIFKSLMKEEEI